MFVGGGMVLTLETIYRVKSMNPCWVKQLNSPYAIACSKNKKSTKLVGHLGKSSNQIFETLTEWNTYLEQHCPDVYPTARIIEPELFDCN